MSDTIADRIAAQRRRIAALNPRYRAFSHLEPLDQELIGRLDGEAAAGRPRGALHGLSVSVKGNIPVAGLPWTEGSAVFAGRVAERDAAVVARARAAGGVVQGLTTLSELAMYGVRNPFEPMGLNPWDVERTAGGSSTGAGVAAALDLADVNIGTDSGGSIRNPACHCGVVGFMPRIGALPLEGKPNHTPSLSSVSLIARTVRRVREAYAALGGDGGATAPEKRLLVPRRFVEAMSDAPTLSLFEAALQRLAGAGFAFVEAEFAGWSAGEPAAGIVSLHESGQALARMDLSEASEGIRRRAEAARRLDAATVSEARTAMERLKAEIAERVRLASAAAIVTPTWPFAAPPIDAETVEVRGRTVPVDPHRNCFVRAANAVDACAITLPMGLYPDAGVPSGLHLMASGGSEAGLLALAEAVETVLPELPPAPLLSEG